MTLTKYLMGQSGGGGAGGRVNSFNKNSFWNLIEGANLLILGTRGLDLHGLVLD